MTELSLKLRYMVIDPCDRGPLHLPMPDGWLDLQDGRLAGTVCDWLARLAWDGWRIDEYGGIRARDVFGLDVEEPEHGDGGWMDAWMSIVSTDPDAPRPEDRTDVDAGTVAGEAYMRIRKAVNLLLLVRDTADGRRIDRDSIPCDTAIHLPDVRRSLSRLREELGSFPGYRLVLFDYEDGLTVNDAWLAAMIDGCDRINEHVHAYARPA